MKIHNAMMAMPASILISTASNQSRRCPRSMMSWAAEIATDRAKKPVQSKFASERSVRSDSATQTQIMAAMPGGTIMKNAPRQV